MKTSVLLSVLSGFLTITGCSRSSPPPAGSLQRQVDTMKPGPEKKHVQAMMDADQWMKDANERDISERNAALQQAPDRKKALAMEEAAMNETYKKRDTFSHQPKFQKLTVEQIIQVNEEIITKSAEAKSRMRQSHYQVPFQPNW